MNDLSLFNSNQKATKEVVTTKQLAEILGVDVRTVQATAIKREIQKHHNLANRQRLTMARKNYTGFGGIE